MVSSDNKKWFALALILAVQFMVILDVAIVNVALPSIQVDLGFSQENLQWVISAYALVFGGFLLLGGRSADLLGRRRVFIVGTVDLHHRVRSSAASRGATKPLIAFRALQGLGAAHDHSGSAVDPRRDLRRGSRTQHRSGSLGRRRRLRGRGRRALRRHPHRLPVLGVDLLGQCPGGIAALILAPFLLAESLDKHGQGFDIPGAILVTSGLSLLVLGITQGRGWGWGSA